ncbi:YkgJ family cysteine cluster protein [Microcoleus sp. B5-D4]|uniref:YkgJ family cysteine cluster protein n=1 Tax=unclassified Microcoleus TaxID=2642155 RepID=UPI002FD26C61
MATWRCVKQCGACCYLDPTERPDLDEYLSEDELALYLSLVGDDGWCINFDRATRECGIYADRPRFCRVDSEVFEEMYGVEPTELNDFAIECCLEHIEDLYGDRSLEMIRFNSEVGILALPDGVA